MSTSSASSAPFPPTGDPASPLSYSKNKTAVLLLDYYNLTHAIVGPELGDPAFAAAGQLATWARDEGMLVVRGLIDLQGPLDERLKGYKHLSAMVQQVLGTSTAEEHPAIKDHDKEGTDVLVYRKPGVLSAMHSTGLQELLQEKGIKCLILAGVATSVCGLSTTRGATDLGYVVTVVSDACADREEETHNAALKIMDRSAYVVTLEALKEAWKN